MYRHTHTQTHPRTNVGYGSMYWLYNLSTNMKETHESQSRLNFFMDFQLMALKFFNEGHTLSWVIHICVRE